MVYEGCGFMMEMIAWDFSSFLVPFSQQQEESICYNQTWQLYFIGLSNVSCCMFTDRDDKHACLSANWVSVYTPKHTQESDDSKFLLVTTAGLTSISIIYLETWWVSELEGKGSCSPFSMNPFRKSGSFSCTLTTWSWFQSFLNCFSFPPKSTCSDVVLSDW